MRLPPGRERTGRGGVEEEDERQEKDDRERRSKGALHGAAQIQIQKSKLRIRLNLPNTYTKMLARRTLYLARF